MGRRHGREGERAGGSGRVLGLYASQEVSALWLGA